MGNTLRQQDGALFTVEVPRCGGALYQRDDDAPDTVRARLATFHRQTKPLIDYYKKAGLLVEVPGDADVEQVGQRTIVAADKVRTK